MSNGKDKKTTQNIYAGELAYHGIIIDVTEIVTVLAAIDMAANSAPLARQARALATPRFDYESAARAAGWAHGGDHGGFWFDKSEWGSWKAAASADDAETYESAEAVCRDYGIKAEAIPSLGYLAVRPKLADALKDAGETIAPLGAMQVWVRRHDDAYHEDPAIVAIAAKMVGGTASP